MRGGCSSCLARWGCLALVETGIFGDEIPGFAFSGDFSFLGLTKSM